MKRILAKATLVAVVGIVATMLVGHVEVIFFNPFTGNETYVTLFG